MVVSIEAKARRSGGWEPMTDNGRNHTGRDVVEWAIDAVSRGAGGYSVYVCRLIWDRSRSRRGSRRGCRPARFRSR